MHTCQVRGHKINAHRCKSSGVRDQSPWLILFNKGGGRMEEMFNSLSTEVKSLSAFEDSKHVDSSITSMSPVPPLYSIKPSASVEILDLAAADITENVPQFIHDIKSGEFFGY
ncbi:hypothetical protein ACTXT7_003316 [Hymenolepis weldensis]